MCEPTRSYEGATVGQNAAGGTTQGQAKQSVEQLFASGLGAKSSRPPGYVPSAFELMNRLDQAENDCRMLREVVQSLEAPTVSAQSILSLLTNLRRLGYSL